MSRISLAAGVVSACLLAAPLVHGQDPYVALMASEVRQDEVTAVIQTLEGFGTRYSFTTECDAAADWLHTVLEGYGLDVSFQEFQYGGKTMRNVIGRLEGDVYPDQVFIVGAHYDSTSETPTVYAPGADDNASGVAGVVEAARILSGYSFESTLEFILFGGEEQGRKGSKHHAAVAALTGKNIVGVVNLDMIGYWPTTSDLEMDIGKNVDSSWLAAVAEQAATDYASIRVHNWPDTGVCYDDQVSYWEKGYDGVVLMDCYEAHLDPGGSGESTPHYHRTTDTIDTLDLVQTTEAVRATVATMALLAGPVELQLVVLVSKDPVAGDVHLAWIGGVPPYTVEACTEKDYSSGVLELTPPGGTSGSQWVHSGVLDDGVDYYYRVSGM